MKQYQYNAVNTNGQKIEGIVEAKDEKHAVDILREKHLLVTNIADPRNNFDYQFKLKFSGIGQNDILNFTKQFSTMIGSGLPMITTLELIRNQSSPAFSEAVEQIISSVQGGDSLYTALSKHRPHFSNLYLALVKAGEMAGALDTVLSRLAKNLDRERDFRAKVKASLLYPAIVSVAMVGVGIIMVFFVMPQVEDLYKQFNAETPFYTQIVLGTASFIRNYWYLFLAIIGGGITALVIWSRSPIGKRQIDRWILEFPYLGSLVNKIVSTDIIKTLALLVRTGVPIVESLNIVSQVTTNSVYQDGLSEAAKDVEKGMGLAPSLAKQHFFPDVVIQMIVVGEETGKMEQMLEKIGKQFEKDTLVALKALTSAIEPAMIIILGIGVGVLVVSVIMPIFNLTSAF